MKPSLHKPKRHRVVTGRTLSANRLVTIQDRIVGDLEALRALLEAAQQATQPVTPRTWREMSWLEKWRWLRTTR